MIMGTGLKDGETLPARIAPYFPDQQIYNFGIGASGPNMLLAMLQSDRLKQSMAESHGVLVYVPIQSHLARVNNFYEESTWSRITPFFEMGDDGRMHRKGSFVKANPLTIGFYDFVRFFQNHFFPNLRFNFPRIRQKHVDYLCNLIVDASKTFTEKFPNSHFVVIDHPIASSDPELFACLKKHQVDARIIKMQMDRPFTIEGDGHPNAAFNQEFAKRLAPELKNLF